MKIFSLFLLVLFICVLGCNEDNPPSEKLVQNELLLSPLTKHYISEDQPVITQQSKRNPISKTIKFFEISGTIEFDSSPTNPCAPYVNVLILGDGNASHLGHYTVLNTYCSDGVNPVSPIYGFITAANGNEIHTQVIESGVDPVLGLYFNYIILGGTGRYEGATGVINMYGYVDVPNLVWTLEGEGSITY